MFSLSAAVLVLFSTVKDSQPSGSAVVPILVGALGTSALIWTLAEVLKRRSRHDDADEPKGREPAAFLTSHGGKTIVEGGSIEGYDSVSRTSHHGISRFVNVKVHRRRRP